MAYRASDAGKAAGTRAAPAPDLFLRTAEFTLLLLFHLNRALASFVPPDVMKGLSICSAGTSPVPSSPPMRHRLDDKIAEAMPEITGRERKTGGGDG